LGKGKKLGGATFHQDQRGLTHLGVVRKFRGKQQNQELKRFLYTAQDWGTREKVSEKRVRPNSKGYSMEKRWSST